LAQTLEAARRTVATAEIPRTLVLLVHGKPVQPGWRTVEIIQHKGEPFALMRRDLQKS
jgi:hypothetical protein